MSIAGDGASGGGLAALSRDISIAGPPACGGSVGRSVASTICAPNAVGSISEPSGSAPAICCETISRARCIASEPAAWLGAGVDPASGWKLRSARVSDLSTGVSLRILSSVMPCLSINTFSAVLSSGLTSPFFGRPRPRFGFSSGTGASASLSALLCGRLLPSIVSFGVSFLPRTPVFFGGSASP